MNLYTIFSEFPPDMRFRSHLNGEIRMAKEWMKYVHSDGLAGYRSTLTKREYGTVEVYVIYFPGMGPAFTEVKNASSEHNS